MVETNEEQSLDIETLYKTNPNIKINSIGTIANHNTNSEYRISGFIDIDGQLFDHSGIYRLFMKDKSFTMFIELGNTLSLGHIFSSKRLSDILGCSCVPIRTGY